jgi:MoaA/NifB/PqqE/SkfB family radical SAM enzyme
MAKIRIVNWLLTRKCNLKCNYCAIVKDYNNMPSSYPPMGYYIQNEMSTQTVIDALGKFKIHNKDIFHIFYGGEPLLRKDLPEIINYCNTNNIHYTIISNNTPAVQPLLIRLFEKVEKVKGFTSSVDPVIFENCIDADDRIKKSIEGFNRLKEMKESGLIDDVVAEITVMNNNQQYLHKLIKELSRIGIYSDITFVDIKKSPYYDFSNVEDETILVKPTFELAKTLLDILNDDLLVHMKDILLSKMFNTLPSNYDCELEKGIHNVTVDADGSMRLCLRIKGALTKHVNVLELFDNDKNLQLVNDKFVSLIKKDKSRYCRLCNHSCLMMSKYIDDTETGNDDLIHKELRED